MGGDHAPDHIRTCYNTPRFAAFCKNKSCAVYANRAIARLLFPIYVRRSYAFV